MERARQGAGSSSASSSGTSSSSHELEEVYDRKTGQTYLKGRLLGKGGFAKCYKFKHSTSKHVCAGKCVEKASLQKERARLKLLSEIKIHRSLAHKNIVRFEHFFEDRNHVYILLEYCNNQTLMELVKRKRRLSEYHTKVIMTQVLQGVEYLHSVNVIHRDLKLGNIFLTDGLQVRIGDFGLATKLDHAGEKKKTMCGTPNYLAPEILDGSSGHSFEVDIWSIGVILYTMLIGKPPFETKNVKQTYKRIQANLYSFPSEIPLTPESISLVRAILNKDPKRRPTLAQIKAHPFFADVQVPLSPTKAKTAASSSTAAALAAVHRGGAKVAKSSPRSATSTKSLRLAELEQKETEKKQHQNEHQLNHDLLHQREIKQQKFVHKAPVVEKWVDYTLKYGLGYIIQGGIVGIYFNDSTKLVVAPNRENFQYYERGSSKYKSCLLSNFDESLKKKVTLLKHFRSYMEKPDNDDNKQEKKQKSVSPTVKTPSDTPNFDGSEGPLPFVKKWVRTRHAIFFRLSNRTVQVAFLDDTQIVISAQAKRLTYFDKQQNTRTVRIEDAKAIPEIQRRLRYTKDVLHTLISPSTDPGGGSGSSKSSSSSGAAAAGGNADPFQTGSQKQLRGNSNPFDDENANRANNRRSVPDHVRLFSDERPSPNQQLHF